VAGKSSQEGGAPMNLGDIKPQARVREVPLRETEEECTQAD